MQSKIQLIHGSSQQIIGAGGQAYSNGYAAGFSFASGLKPDHATVNEQHRSTGKLPQASPCFDNSYLPVHRFVHFATEFQGDGILSPYDPVWAAPASTAYKSAAGMSFARSKGS